MNFSRLLTLWYLKNKRNLPWRMSTNPYKVWLSEIILQQTQIAQGTPYYNKFISEFPDVEKLAQADEQKILKLWQGLGYYSRARNLLTTAKYISSELNGKFPDNYADLLKLKGVGPYSAAAIASICFDEPKAVLDGNVYRVLSRYFNIDTPINSSRGKNEFNLLAQNLIDTKNSANHNQAVMELGALICKPNNPFCSNCPLNKNCLALKNKTFDKLPVKLKKEPIKKRYFNYLYIKTNSNKTVFLKRIENDIWFNLYQFPLIETSNSINNIEIQKQPEFQSLFKSNKKIDFKCFNNVDIITKLTHQHIFTKFWIIEIDEYNQATVKIDDLKKHPVPMLIHNFLKAFKLT